MIKANHKKFIVKFSNYYSKFLLDIYFRGIKYIGEYEKTDMPVFIISNHFSWWDGFIQIQLNNKYYKRRYHFMMLEEELLKSMVINKIGAFSIKKNHRSSIESLKYASEILQNPENLLLIFPQGTIQSIYTDSFRFENGLSYIFRKLKSDVQLVYNVNLFDYSSFRRPEISVYFRSQTINHNATLQNTEAEFNRYYQECKKIQTGV